MASCPERGSVQCATGRLFPGFGVPSRLPAIPLHLGSVTWPEKNQEGLGATNLNTHEVTSSWPSSARLGLKSREAPGDAYAAALERRGQPFSRAPLQASWPDGSRRLRQGLA